MSIYETLSDIFSDEADSDYTQEETDDASDRVDKYIKKKIGDDAFDKLEEYVTDNKEDHNLKYVLDDFLEMIMMTSSFDPDEEHTKEEEMQFEVKVSYKMMNALHKVLEEFDYDLELACLEKEDFYTYV